MKKISVLLIGLFFIVGCFASQPPTKSQPVVQAPELKLRIEGVEKVQAETSDTAERSLTLEEKRLELEREKWEFEKKQKQEELFNSQISYFCDWRQDPPVFTLYSGLSILDWKALKKDFAVLFSAGKRIVNVDMQTGGGSVFAGTSLADTILKYRKKGMKINIHASGLIASAAVPIFAVGERRIAAKNTLFMVHESSMFKFWTSETHSDIRAQKEMMDLSQKNYIQLLVDHTKKDYDFWLALEGRTTWFSAEQALEWGLVDEIE